MVCIVVLATACSSSSKKTAPPPASSTTSTTTTTPPARAASDVLVFREVVATLPYEDATALTMPTRTPSSTPEATSCNGGKLVTPGNKDTLAAPQVILPDRDKAVCYAIGPTLLAPRNITESVAAKDPMGGWDVSVHFGNDDFVQKIGRPMVGKNVAIIVRHVVWSAPVIQEQITTPDVRISGNLDEQSARELANALR